jgi:hypothetical protein
MGPVARPAPLDAGGSMDATTGVELSTALKPVQSLPETVQVLRPPGTWTVPGASV